MELSKPVFRFKYCDDFINHLSSFSKIHQFDDRKTFKDSWNEWITENIELVENEKSRLKELGYIGDINDKMYKSARYYFRKKTTSKIEPKKRTSYITLSKEILFLMDEQIKNLSQLPASKPSEGFDRFLENNEQIISEEIIRLRDKENQTKDEIIKKIKKTYKNRYFICVLK